MKGIDYEKLRLDVLEKLISERSIECKNNRTDMIKHLKLEEEGKYVRETVYEKIPNGFIVGIDLRNKKHLNEMSQIIIRKDGVNLNRYSCGRNYYFTKQKLT